MRLRALVLVFGVCWAIGSAIGPARASPGSGGLGGARAFVAEIAKDAAEIAAASGAIDAKMTRYAELLRETFALEAMARLALGKAWRAAAEPAREAYLAAFERWVIATHVQRLAGFRLERVEIGQVRPAGRDAMVESRASGEGFEGRVDWRVRETEAGLRVIDLVIEGVSMVVTQRAEFASIASRRGLRGLARRLDEIAARCAGCP